VHSDPFQVCGFGFSLAVRPCGLCFLDSDNHWLLIRRSGERRGLRPKAQNVRSPHNDIVVAPIRGALILVEEAYGIGTAIVSFVGQVTPIECGDIDRTARFRVDPLGDEVTPDKAVPQLGTRLERGHA
jgi:hypothetical protein